MKIAELVRAFIPKIIDYCENIDYQELARLQDLNYSKEKLGIGFPFWSMIENIESSKRYWKDIYEIDQKKFRVSSQWFTRNTDARFVLSEEEELKLVEYIKESNESLQKIADKFAVSKSKVWGISELSKRLA